MKPVRALAVYIPLVFLGAGLLAPWGWWCAQWLAQTFPGSGLFAGLAGTSLDKYVLRLLLLLALAGLWPLARSLGARSAGDLGLVSPTGQGRKLAIGFTLGFVTLAIAATVIILCGGRTFRVDLTLYRIGKSLVTAGLAAVAVSLIEEIFFRGAIFGGLRRAHRWPVALLASSSIYSLLHFFQKAAPPAEVTWSSGLEVLPQMMAGLARAHTLLPQFLTLLLAGCILGLAYHRTGNLYCSIGIHAGWVFWVKLYGFVTVRPPAADHAWLWGTGKLIDSWVALVLLVPALLLLPRLVGGRKPDGHAA